MNEFEKKINELCFHYTLNLIFKDNLINLKKELNKFNNKNEIKMNLYFSISQSIIYPFTDILLDLYHTELKTNSMLGNNSSERLKSFVSEFEQDHWEKINLTYPVFFSTSELIVNDTTEYVSKILSNLINDNAELLSKFKIDYQKLLDIRLGKGDTHSGKSVAKLMFRSPDEKKFDELLYKPRSNKTDITLKRCTDFISEGLNINFKFPKSLCNRNYSWYENIEHVTTDDQVSINHYYYRSGCLLGLFWILGTTDIHSENIITNAGYPIVIDIETLSKGLSDSEDKDVNFRLITSSVLSSCLLPVGKTFKGDSNFDFNGLFPKAQIGETAFEYRIVTDQDLDWAYEMYPASIKNQKSKVTTNYIYPEEAFRPLKSGFFDTLSFIQKNSTYFLKIIKNNYVSRQLLRDTQVYADFVHALQLPDNLKSVQNQQHILNILKDEFKPSKFGLSRLKNEVQSISKWDIPSFYTTNTSKNLLNFNGNTVIKNFWALSPEEAITKRVNSINLKSIKYQLRIIDLSLATFYKSDDLFNVSNNNNNPVDIPIFTQQIKEEYFNQLDAIFNPSFGTSKIEDLYTLEFGNDVTITTLQPGLYNSVGFLLSLWRYTQTKNVTEEERISIQRHVIFMYSQLVSPLKRYKDLNIDDINVSVFSGLGGLLYCSCYLYLSTNEFEYVKDIKLLVQIICSRVLNTEIEELNFEYLNGISGLLLLFQNLYKNVKLSNIVGGPFKKIIAHLSNIPFNQIINEDDVGIGHGISGKLIGMSVLKLHGVNISNDVEKKCLSKVLNSISRSLEFNSSWCRGTLGILDMLLINNKLNNSLYTSSMTNKFLKKYSYGINRSLECQKNISMCHGLGGIINFITSVNETKHNEIVPENKFFSKLPNLRDTRVIRSSDFHPVSYMLSTTGLVDSILRYKNNMPNMVHLDIPNNV